jgi:hypothetical protein
VNAHPPVDVVIFDNARILYGRATISGASDCLFKGWHADRDDHLATLARLRHRPAS